MKFKGTMMLLSLIAVLCGSCATTTNANVDNLRPNSKPAATIRRVYYLFGSVTDISNTASELHASGKISTNGYTRIIDYLDIYIQLNPWIDLPTHIVSFLAQENMTAEEFCLGVDKGSIRLTF